MTLLLRMLVCIFALGFCLYLYIDAQNDRTELQREIPKLEKRLRTLKQEAARLQYEVDRFESPVRLLHLAQQAEFGHLDFPRQDSILDLPTGAPVDIPH